MDVVFLDTSALVKLYLPELGATWLRNFVASQQITISELALYEVITVLRRLHIEGMYTKSETFVLLDQIDVDSTKYEVISLGGKSLRDRIISLIFSLPNTVRIRALDAIHLTAADIALEDANSLSPPPSFTFVSADAQLLRVAQAVGWVVENPENYP